MGVNIGDLVPKKEIELANLKGKTLAVDAMNTLYQFLSIIRQPDGTPLMDSHGRITSHLSGLIYRTANLVELGVRPVFVFDGEPPKLKKRAISERREVREKATEEWKKALAKKDMKEARKHAQAALRLTDEMINDSKEFIELMGLPWVQAPSEGEAQAAYIARERDVWSACSQDFDSLLFGAPRLVRNVTISGRRKLPGKDIYKEVKPEIAKLQNCLDKWALTNRSQLVDIGILVGTDFNPDGVRGIGPKRALDIVKKNNSLENAIAVGEISEDDFPVDPLEIKKVFMKPAVTDNYEITWGAPDDHGIKEFLCAERDFSKDRVEKAIQKLASGLKEAKSQISLDKWF